MKLNWEKWGYDFVTSVLRHTGTAGLAALATATSTGKLDWHALGWGILCGGIIPTVFTFLQKTPLPEDEEKPQPKEQ